MSTPPTHRLRRRRVAAALLLGGLAALATLACAGAPARAYTAYVDGISDQSLPSWDAGFQSSYFAGFFAADWVARGHIRIARFVVQWNVISAGPAGSRVIFEDWLRDVGATGLTVDLGLTSYDGLYPSSADAYRQSLQALLDRAAQLGVHIGYVEAWNEPNNQGREPPAVAAALTNAASATCAAGYGCTVIAGDLEDAPAAGRYEREYERLLHPVPTVWGVHPYRSVEELSEAPYLNLLRDMPRRGVGDRVWITEVGARACHDYDGRLVEHGELGQEQRARWLVDDLIRNRRPEHVLYYELLLEDRRPPGCPGRSEDEALYVPSADPNAPDAPRPAANLVLTGRAVPSAYTGAASIGSAEPAATLGGSIYPGGLLDARYHFEYGLTPGYGRYSAAADAGAGTGMAPAGLAVDGLLPGSTYHYRLVAWNAEGAEGPSYGADRTFATPAAFDAEGGAALGATLGRDLGWGAL